MREEIKESLMTADEVLDSMYGSFIVGEKNKENFYFDSVVTDSRNVCKNSLFVPLIGQSQNGHKYIPQAIEKGATVIFVAEQEYNLEKLPL